MSSLPTQIIVAITCTKEHGLALIFRVNGILVYWQDIADKKNKNIYI